MPLTDQLGEIATIVAILAFLLQRPLRAAWRALRRRRRAERDGFHRDYEPIEPE